MNAKILIVGDEILIGQVVDTNSNFIAGKLNDAGIKVVGIETIADGESYLTQALSQAINKVDLLIISGGLGPTSDDFTKPALAQYFGSKLMVDKAVETHILQMLSEKNIPITDNNLKQAWVPENCTVLFNKNGTAPGMWFNTDKTVIISLPGVPFELHYLMENEVLPKLKQEYKISDIYHKTIMTKGLPEAILSVKLSEWEKQLPETIHLAYLPSPEAIRLRLSVYGMPVSDAEQLVNYHVKQLYNFIAEYIFAESDIPLEKVIHQLLVNSGKSLSTAESCTGGNIARLITAISGCSKYFEGSVVAYSNEIKNSILQVSASDLETFGAVSIPVVEQMAKGSMQRFKTDYAVATSGIAGPEGGTPGKPVGTVCIAVASKNKIVSETFLFSKLRDVNIRRASSEALNMLRKLIIEENSNN